MHICVRIYIVCLLFIFSIDYYYLRGAANCGPLWHLSMCCIPSSICIALVVRYIFRYDRTVNS